MTYLKMIFDFLILTFYMGPDYNFSAALIINAATLLG